MRHRSPTALHFRPSVDAATGRLHALQAVAPGLATGRLVASALAPEQAWRAKGHRRRLAVVLSGEELRDPALAIWIRRLRTRYGFPADDVLLGARAGDLPEDPVDTVDELWVGVDAGAAAVRDAREKAAARGLRLVVQHVDLPCDVEVLGEADALQGDLVCAPLAGEAVAWWLDARAALVSVA